MRYWYNDGTDEYVATLGDVEAQRYASSVLWREIDRIDFDEAMRSLK